MKKNFFKIIIIFIVFILFNLFLYNEENVNAESTSQEADIQLLARAINGEARGEPYEGQVAVGAVILNRVKHASFPNTIAGVIYEPRCFYSCS